MNDELRALSFLRKSLIVKQKDTLERASEYEVLKGGATFFFRNGTGEVYETSATGGFINSYTEEYLNEVLMLREYTDKVMANSELQQFLQSREITELYREKSDTAGITRIITAGRDKI